MATLCILKAPHAASVSLSELIYSRNSFRFYSDFAPDLEMVDDPTASYTATSHEELTTTTVAVERSLHLDLSNNTTLTDRDLADIVTFNVKTLGKVLVSLNVCNTRISDECLAALFKYSPSLKVVLLEGSRISDFGLSALAKHCKDVEALNLKSCANISDYGVQICVQEFKCLRKLDLNGCRVTDALLPHLSHYAPSLMHLDLGNTTVSAEGMCLLFSMLPLRYAGMESSTLNDQQFHKICRAMPSLRSVDISFCYRISEKGIQSMRGTRIGVVKAFGLCAQIPDDGGDWGCRFVF